MTYCEKARNLEKVHLDRIHHDTVHGFAVNDDNELFGRLILEINQAGLSWLLMLKKQDNFKKAFSDFDVSAVSEYGESDRRRLLSDAGIVRNRVKIDSVIHNAAVIRKLQKEHTSFKAWLDRHHPRKPEEWTRLFKNTFRFMGPEIVNEFLMSTGYLPGAHNSDCPVYGKVILSGPMWLKKTG